MGNPKTTILKNRSRSRIKETGDRKKKILYQSTLKEKMYAFTHDIRTKNIGDIHMYHGDSSMLTERNREKMYTPNYRKTIYPILNNRI
jgi:hypothetical protein